jgi:hypothetical protein
MRTPRARGFASRPPAETAKAAVELPKNWRRVKGLMIPLLMN